MHMEKEKHEISNNDKSSTQNITIPAEDKRLAYSRTNREG